MTAEPSGPELRDDTADRNKVCVRDVSWHCEQPVLMSAGWLGTRWTHREGSMVARHEVSLLGLMKVPGRVLMFCVFAVEGPVEDGEQTRRLR